MKPSSLISRLTFTRKFYKGLFQFMFPFFLTALVYDSQRLYSNWIRGPVHIKEPYLFDKKFFGISTAEAVLTPNEWWQFHTHPILDLVTGFAYLVFLGVFMSVCGYFLFRLRRPEEGLEPNKLKLSQLALQTPWAFFWLNVLGYSTYYVYAAAPPWYVSQYGLAQIRLDIPPSPAGCARFDSILGTHFFSAMYGHSANVFGAIPSLHVAYPMLATYFAFRFKVGRTFCVGFYLLMCFSAVYLNHHYILDILVGSLYAIIVGWTLDKLFQIRHA